LFPLLAARFRCESRNSLIFLGFGFFFEPEGDLRPSREQIVGAQRRGRGLFESMLSNPPGVPLISSSYEIVRIIRFLGGGTLVGPEPRQNIGGHLIRCQARGFTVRRLLDPLCVERGRGVSLCPWEIGCSLCVSAPPYRRATTKSKHEEVQPRRQHAPVGTRRSS